MRIAIGNHGQRRAPSEHTAGSRTIMINPAVRKAFASRPQPQASCARPPTEPKAVKGGLDVLYHVQLGDHLENAAVSSCGRMLAAATAGASVLFVDAKDGTVSGRCDTLGEDSPNAIAWSADSSWIVCCSDDGCARVISVDSGALVLEHLIAEEPEPGKRKRCVPSEQAIVLDGASFVAAAGHLIHTCGVPDGRLRSSLSADAPVRGLCRSPPSLMGHWAYAAAYKGGVLLVSPSGDGISKLSSRGHLRSLAMSDQWLAAAAFDGSIELWDVAKRAATTSQRRREADKTTKAFCGSDGA
eukprot:6990112-Prymnesium_polylepis.1